MQNTIKKIKDTIDVIVMAVQKVLISVSLVLVYFFGFGIIYLFCLIFNRKAICGAPRNNPTFWTRADDFESDMTEAARQS